MSNIFRSSAHNYFQLSNAWISDWYSLLPSSKDLLVFLSAEAERYSSNILTRSTKKILQTTGMSKRAFIPARRQLEERGIVGSEEVGRGLWRFTIETYDRSDLYRTLTADEVEAYFTPHLERIAHNENGIVADCPFHHKRSSFFLKTVDHDGKGIGVWSCLCNYDKSTGDGMQNGGLEKFEMKLQRISEKDRDVARSNIAHFLTAYRKRVRDTEPAHEF